MSSEKIVARPEEALPNRQQRRFVPATGQPSPVPASGRGRAPVDTALLARVAELEAENHQLRQECARAHRILRSTVDYALITLDDQGCITGWNAGARHIFGYSEAEVLGRSADLVFTPEDRDGGRLTLEMHGAIETGRAANDGWRVRRDGTRFWASGQMMPLLDEDGSPNGILCILRDRTELQTQVERRELLMAEMNHRVKNTFAIVQAIAAQSSRHATTTAEFKTSFESRLVALARSHDLLIKGGWRDACLQNIVEGALGTFCSEPGRVTIEGASVMVPADVVVAFTLAFHELAMNAAKHGSLSIPVGAVDVSWLIRPGEKGGSQVELVWRERGGPQVSPPKRQGFGSQLLARSLRDLGSTLTLDFQPAGLECRICFPLGSGRS